MKKILLPLEETTRSLMALAEVKTNYSPQEYEVVVLMIDESIDYMSSRESVTKAIANLEQKLELVTGAIDEFKVSSRAEVGKAGAKIVQVAREIHADLIVMTKSAQEDMRRSVGTTAMYVLNNASCNVMIVQEDKTKDAEYKGLVYRKAAAVVNLWGNLSLKQSECMLPSVNVNCIYTINVTCGKVRFIHRSYNPDTMRWDREPLSGQPEFIDISAKETVQIPVRAYSVDGKADRIRVVNRNMKSESVFSYSIAADKRVILASQNKGKIAEIGAILKRYGMEIVSRDDAGLPRFEIEETGATFEENSYIKAKTIMDIAHCPVIADDSGLMVDALGGGPGVYSARYAGEGCTYDDNNNKLLKALENVPDEERGAKFVSVITMLFPDGRKLVARGECPGVIAKEKQGEGGFGYDPIFLPLGLDRSFGQMSPEEKNLISHRAHSLRKLEELLENSGE